MNVTFDEYLMFLKFKPGSCLLLFEDVERSRTTGCENGGLPQALYDDF